MAFPFGAAIGGLAGLGSSLFGGGSSIDPATQAYLNRVRQFALNSRGLAQGPDQSVFDAMNAYRQFLPGINLGIGALSGDQDILRQMIAPGQSALNTIFDRQQDVGLNNVRKQLTLAGGLGNTRSALPIGSFLSDLAGQRAQGTLGLFNQAYNNAGQLLNFGMGAAGGLGSLGQYVTGLPLQQAQQIMQILNMGIGPLNTQNASPNPLTSALGGAIVGNQLFPRKVPQDQGQPQQSTQSQPNAPWTVGVQTGFRRY